MPRVSVVMPVYNARRFLREAVQSILEQTYTDFELIAVDDASTDESRSLLEDFAGWDARVIVVPQPRNQGVRAALHAGVERARGEYIARMDADDFSLPNRLAQQVAFLDENPAVAVVGTWAQAMDDHGQPGVSITPPTPPGEIGWQLLFGSVLIHPSVMMRRSMVAEVGFYRDLTMYCEDYELWTRINRRFSLANLPIIGLRYRLTTGSATNQRSRRDAIHLVQQNALDWMNEALPSSVAEYLHDISFSASGPPIPVSELRATVTTLNRFHAAWLRQRTLPPAEQHAIQSDLARRLLRLAKRGWPSAPGQAVLTGLQALQADPALPLRLVQQRLLGKGPV